MTETRLSRRLKEKQVALGTWITLADPGIAIMLANAGFDWVFIDNEHNPFSEPQIQALIHALRGSDVTPVVRVRGNDPAHIKWVLDTGARGIIIPMLQDAADARRAVEAAKYHPLGKRGYGPMRATDFWKHKKQYDETANTDIILIGQIECATALSDIESIAQVEGLDGVFIGPEDLAYSLGHGGNSAHPEVQAAIDRIIETANRHGKPWGIPAGKPEAYASFVRRGGLIMTMGSDSYFIRLGSAELVRTAGEALAQAELQVSTEKSQPKTKEGSHSY